jgi:hypothetical protein
MNPMASHIIGRCLVSRRVVARVVLGLALGMGPAVTHSHGAFADAAVSTPLPMQTPRQSAPSKRSTGGTLSGKVLLDGVPTAEVHISVTPVRQLTGSASVSALMARSEGEETDDDGSFAVEGLEPGAYAVSVEAPGYMASSGLTDQDGKPIYYRPGDQVTIRMVKGGVITGKVTDSQGQPVVQIPIRALRLRDEKGHPSRAAPKAFSGFGGVRTDDRGIYRLYGLEPGVYLVSAGGGEQFSSTPFTSDSPVYHPSGTVDVAAEVKVQAGQDTGGIDISYSSLPGHSVSGHLAGQFATGGVMSLAALVLTHLKTGMPQAETVSMGESHAFRIEGVPDGDYFLTAISYSFGKDLTAAPPTKIAVKGSDVTGIEMTLGPITAISGKVVIEALKQVDQSPACKTGSPRRVEDIIVAPHPSERSKAAEQIPMVLDLTESSQGSMTSPDAKGEFSAQLPSGGSYHIETQLLDDDLFLSSVTLPPDQAGKPPKDASGGIAVKNSERISNLTVTVAQGGAAVAGRISPSAPGAVLPEKMRAHLVPVEKEAADNTLRYYDAIVRRDGSFELKHIAPGRYYVLARVMSQEEWDEVNPRPIWWGAASRQKLRQEADQLNTVVELKPCQQIKGLSVQYTVPAATVPGPGKTAWITSRQRARLFGM